MKRKPEFWILGLALLILIIYGATAQISPPTNLRGYGSRTITDYLIINGTNITAMNLNVHNPPSACPSGSYMTQFTGLTAICEVITAINTLNVTTLNGVYFVEGNNVSDLNYSVSTVPANGRVIVVPRYDYHMTEPLKINSNTHILLFGRLHMNGNIPNGTDRGILSISDVTDQNISIIGSGTIYYNLTAQDDAHAIIDIGNHYARGVKNIKIEGINIVAFGNDTASMQDMGVGVELSDDVTIKNIFVTGDVDYGITANNVSNLKVIHNTIRDTNNHGLGLGNSVDSQLLDNFISVTSDDDSSFQGITIYGNTGTRVAGNRLVNNVTNPNVGIVTSGDKNITVKDNLISGFSTGILLGYHIAYSTIDNNEIYGSIGDCIQVISGAEENTITNNKLRNCGGYGIYYDSSVRKISDNHIAYAGNDGIYLGNYADRAHVSDNVIEASGQNASYVNPSGIRLAAGASYITVSDNKIFDIQGIQTQDYGIYCNTTAGNNDFLSNDIRNNGVASWGGDCTVHSFINNPNDDGKPDIMASDIDMNGFNIRDFINASMIDHNLSLFYAFENGTGTIAYDSSLNSRDGDIVNGPTWVTGVKGYALKFDDNDDYIVNNSVTDPLNETFSILFWIYPYSFATDHRIIEKGNNGDWKIVWQSNMMYFGDGGFTGNEVGTAVTAEAWSHIGITYDGTTMRFYKDGRLVDSDTHAVFADAWDKITIANYGGTKSFGCNCTMDELRLYPRSLSREEVNALYYGLGSQGTAHITRRLP